MFPSTKLVVIGGVLMVILTGIFCVWALKQEP